MLPNAQALSRLLHVEPHRHPRQSGSRHREVVVALRSQSSPTRRERDAATRAISILRQKNASYYQ
ncbi:uncharacterized protein PHACADRAFT_265793 [Phanerochaete carnosa HHB-10118-sp]|uniref:Uncharacterized protein n=1 Tax=Phanerochaete carnosa (strain HHB-10118-sp) TaxID=650164 RepID=K5VJD9_PHACS|nr:uncharacterized protein PHACADRAFT_263572 [Phanerochaete carnosa HHB-10118-sp]XP_007402305.1 uncharacterized protein PHACADRAFT_265793 [Phanerochaete carnosa HHB-10118-sp]EKM49146.1 hypothetical protein PHACADRAFT_265793 [Phanerochaete carnosa HHB-10118-sp]EKM51443.1 hypothetical protein PHACADRAFT_263572 [Phanerochaete carnosa HHB-10118-sp]